MSARVQPIAVDLTGFPDLTVVYLGMKVTRLIGFRTLLGFGPAIAALDRDKPDGLLRHETFLWSLDHVGIRQYWRDFDALERFTRSAPHKQWWAKFTKDQKGTAFWHETYRRAGGMEGIYIALPQPAGFGAFAPHRKLAGAYASSRQRLAA